MPSALKLSVAACLRVFVVGLDAFFALIGLMTVLLTIICYAMPYLHEFSHALNKVISVNLLVIGTMVIGLVFIGVGGLGCYGAYSRNPFYLGVHIGVMLVMYMFQAVIMYTFRREWEEKLSLGVSFGVMDYDPEDPQRRYMDGIQRALDCCGGGSPKDYRFNVNFNKKTVPISCCKSHIPQILAQCEQMESGSIPLGLAYELGCRNRLHNLLWPCILGVVVSLGALGFCCILFPSMYIYIMHLIDEEEKAEEVSDSEDEESTETDRGQEKMEDEPFLARAAVTAPVRKSEMAVQVDRATEDALDQLQAMAQRLAGLDAYPVAARTNRAVTHSFAGEPTNRTMAIDGYQRPPAQSRRALSLWDERLTPRLRGLGESYPKFRDSFG